VPDNIKENLEIRAVKWIDEVLSIALERSPEPLSDEEYLANTPTQLTDSGDEDAVSRPRSH
jgi:ATP-dependent Lon protease